LSDDLVFVGLFETYPNADAYMAALTGLLSITLRLDVKTIIAGGNQAAIFFELETMAPAAAITLVLNGIKSVMGKSFELNRPSMADLSRPCSQAVKDSCYSSATKWAMILNPAKSYETLN
jgi:hypothetical protein